MPGRQSLTLVLRCSTPCLDSFTSSGTWRRVRPPAKPVPTCVRVVLVGCDTLYCPRGAVIKLPALAGRGNAGCPDLAAALGEGASAFRLDDGDVDPSMETEEKVAEEGEDGQARLPCSGIPISSS